MVRSKSELTIADRLYSNKIDYLYEQPLTIGGKTRYPDFTIEDSESGRKYYSGNIVECYLNLNIVHVGKENCNGTMNTGFYLGKRV